MANAPRPRGGASSSFRTRRSTRGARQDKLIPTQFVPLDGAADWMRLGACKGVSTGIFFLGDDDQIPGEAVRAMCEGCPVREQCLQWALSHDEYGYWGGTTRTQREAILSGRDRVKCPLCESRDIVSMPREHICISCGLSW